MRFWQVLWVLLIMVPLTVAWVFAVFDIFHRGDLPGWGKAAWFAAVIILPWLGTLLYLLFRPREISEEHLRAQVAAREAYEKSLAADQLAKLAALHSKGELSDQEYASAKAHLLMSMGSASEISRGPQPPGTAAPTH